MAFVRGLWAAAFRPELFFRRCRVCGVPIPAGAAAAAAGWPPPGVSAACAERLAARQGGFCPRSGALGAGPAGAPAFGGACLSLPRALSAPGGDPLPLIDPAVGAAANSWGTGAVAFNVNVVSVRSPSPGATLRAEAAEVHRPETASTGEIRVLGEDGRLIATAQATGYRKKERLPFRI